MQETPLVTVVIPTRDRAGLITRAVESAKRQTYPNFEILVVDDGSRDETPTVLSEISGIRVISLSDSVGGAAARNIGIAEARGDLIAFLDSDDEWLPDKLERQVPALLSEDRVGAVYCRHFTHDDITGIEILSDARLYQGNILPDLLTGHCPRTVSLFLVRRTALSSVAGFDEAMVGFQDTDLWIRIAHEWRFAAVDEALAIVHEHSGSRVTTDPLVRQRALDSFLDKWGAAMELHLGARGVRRYRRSQLAVARGSAVLSLVDAGRRGEAILELGRYVKDIRLTQPIQFAGLIAACIGGMGVHTKVKSWKQRYMVRL